MPRVPRQLLIAAIALLLAFPLALAAAHPLSQGRYMLMAASIAHMHGLDVNQFMKVIECESEWNPEAHSGYHLPNGELENSWGIAQWNLDTNDLTLAEALDPEFALTKMAEYWAEGKESGWKCYELWSARGWK
jgi:hypothetical protein